MKLYSWKLFNYECKCDYSVMAESLEEARGLILYELTKNIKSGCDLCLIPEEPGGHDIQNMSFNERKKVMAYHFNRGKYVIRNWIRDTEPEIYDAKKLILYRGIGDEVIRDWIRDTGPEILESKKLFRG